MAKLSRVRFVSLGHEDARIDDLTLDFRDEIGRAVDSTIWLRNGGGKSSLLNLIFSLLQPSRRQFLGGKEGFGDRLLEEYVSRDDHGVVIAEWELPTAAPTLADGLLTPERYLTGVFYEWKVGRNGEDAKLERLFFAARVDAQLDELTIEGLPLYAPGATGATGQRVMASFKAEWLALRARAPHAGVGTYEKVKEWEEVLEHIGLDPDLFRYQVRMNTQEGGADQLFVFSTVEEFVDFFLELVLDPGVGEQIATNIVTFRDDLRRRARELVPERALVESLQARLQPLWSVSTRRDLVRQAAREARRTLWHLDRHAIRRADSLAADVARLEQEQQEAGSEAATLRATADQSHRRATAYRRQAADSTLTHAEAAADSARKRHTVAQRDQRIWEAAVPLRDALRHEQNARTLERDLEQIQAQHAPLLADVRVAADAYADTMRARLEAASTLLESLRAEQHEHQTDASAARDRAMDAQREETEATARAHAAERQLEAERRSRETLSNAGALEPDEAPLAANERWIREREGASLLAEQLADIAATALADARREDARAAAAGREIVVQEGILRTEQALLRAADQAEAQLAQSPLLARALEVAPDALAVRALGPEAVRQVRNNAHAYLQREVNDRIGRETDERARLSLEATNLLPPRRDVERVLSTLADLRAGAWSGWTYLSANEPAGGVRAFLRTAPAIADGVVVRDADYARVLERLAATPMLDLEAPVLVVAQSAIGAWSTASSATVAAAATRTEGSDTTLGIVVGPASDAFYSTAAGQQELSERRQRLETAERRIDEAHQTRMALEVLATTLEQFLARYPTRWWVDRRAAIAEAEQQRHTATTQQTAAVAAAQTARQRAEDAESARRTADERAQRALRHADRIGDHLRLHPKGSAPYADALTLAHADASIASTARETALEEAATHDSHAHQLGGRLEDVAGDRRTAEADLRRIQYADPARTVAAPGHAEALREQYEQQLARYSKAVGADATQALLLRATTDAQAARVLVAKRLKDGVAEADVRAALDALTDHGLADDRRTDAIEAVKSAFGSMGNLGQRVDAAKEAARLAREAANALGAMPALSEDERHREPAVLEQQAAALDQESRTAATNAEEYDQLADAAKEEARTLSLRGQEIRTARQMLEAAWGGFGSLLGQLVPSAGAEEQAQALAEPFTAPASDESLAEAVRALQATLAQVRTDTETLDRERLRIVREVTGLLTNSSYESVKGPLVADLRRWDEREFEDRVADVTQQLGLRLTYITSLMEQADRHRNTLIDGAMHATEEALRLLADAGRQSKVPDHVPGIGGSYFFKISFKVSEDVAERRQSLGALIDELAERTDAIPKGLAFVQRCVERLAHPMDVRVLFPDPDREPEYRRVTTIGKFSTGQRLTCATLLYLTLANLRARARWRQAAPTGVLICDNPFGKASRTSFIEMQREVARCGGIQLIYTTGINDYEALAMLPNVIRLDNSRQDRRTGERVMELVPATSGPHPKRPMFPAGSVGVLDAVRIGRTVVPTTSVRGGVAVPDPVAATTADDGSTRPAVKDRDTVSEMTTDAAGAAGTIEDRRT